MFLMGRDGADRGARKGRPPPLSTHQRNKLQSRKTTDEEGGMEMEMKRGETGACPPHPDQRGKSGKDKTKTAITENLRNRRNDKERKLK